MKDEIVSYIQKHKGKTTKEIAEHFFPGQGVKKKDIINGIINRNDLRKFIRKESRSSQENGMKKVNIRAYKNVRQKELPPKTVNPSRILVIGDLHEPFSKPGYLAFCKRVYRKYDITHVIFIGDIIDNHFASYHETDPDGLGGKHELDLAIQNVGKWVKAFPHADVIIGNHDRLILRKAFTGGIPSMWIKDFRDVLNAPGWNFTERMVYNDIQFIHGLGSRARAQCRKDLMSTVQGHFHTDAYVEYVVGQNFKIFGMQTGCGVDRKSYAMAYACNWPKQAIAVGVILEDGELPFNVMMPM